MSNLVKVVSVASSPSIPRDFCRLPADFMRRYGLFERASVVVIEVSYQDKARETTFCKWNSEVSTQFPECIEILNGDSTATSADCRIAQVIIHRHVQAADQVFVRTSSRYDWEILDSQPQAAEEVVLQQVLNPKYFDIFNVSSSHFRPCSISPQRLPW